MTENVRNFGVRVAIIDRWDGTISLVWNESRKSRALLLINGKYTIWWRNGFGHRTLCFTDFYAYQKIFNHAWNSSSGLNELDELRRPFRENIAAWMINLIWCCKEIASVYFHGKVRALSTRCHQLGHLCDKMVIKSKCLLGLARENRTEKVSLDVNDDVSRTFHLRQMKIDIFTIFTQAWCKWKL